MPRRDWLGASAALLGAPGLAQPSAPHDNTLRVAFRVAETGFDPVAIGDENSNRVAACIFESPLTYDPLARPVKMVPLTAEALPEVEDDSRSFTSRIRPGIFFADAPAFGGRPRELVARDYVYAIKRYYDPRNNSELLYLWENAGVLGLASTSSQLQRRSNELWRKHLVRIGVRIEFDIATWPDLLKRSRNATLMMWGYSWVAQSPDGGFFLGIAYGPNAHESNDARCPPSTACSSARACCPTAQSARR
jgi:ABC-type transport system substrate-binding protein